MKLNKFSTAILLVASASYLSACVPALVGGAAAGGTYVAKDKRSFGTIVDDAAITSTIKGKYLNDELVSAVDIHVDTSKGVVTLSGHVPSARAKVRALSLAKNTKHVAAIIDKLTIAN